MLIRDLSHLEEMVAGDNTTLREVLHPRRDGVPIPYSLAHASIRPGEASLSHRLKGSEVYYILQGQGIMHVNGESAEVKDGQAIYVPPRAAQHIENTGNTDLIFLCIVNPAWRVEDEEVEARNVKRDA